MKDKKEQVLKSLKKLFDRGYSYTLDTLAKVTQTSRPTIRKYLKLYTKTTGQKIAKATARKGKRGPESVLYGHAAS